MSASVDVLSVIDEAAAEQNYMARTGCTNMTIHYDAEFHQRLKEARAAVAQLVHYGHKIEQRRRGVLHGDADAEAQDWAEFRAALTRFGRVY